MTGERVTWLDGSTETFHGPIESGRWLEVVNDIFDGLVVRWETLMDEPPVTNAYGLGPGLTEAMRANGDAPAESEWYHESSLGPKWALAASAKRKLYVYDFNTGLVTVVE